MLRILLHFSMIWPHSLELTDDFVRMRMIASHAVVVDFFSGIAIIKKSDIVIEHQASFGS